jgi:hypothetical protein
MPIIDCVPGFGLVGDRRPVRLRADEELVRGDGDVVRRGVVLRGLLEDAVVPPWSSLLALYQPDSPVPAATIATRTRPSGRGEVVPGADVGRDVQGDHQAAELLAVRRRPRPARRRSGWPWFVTVTVVPFDEAAVLVPLAGVSRHVVGLASRRGSGLACSRRSRWRLRVRRP